jgi:TolB-like protein/Tfp pilus assembly protein PilF
MKRCAECGRDYNDDSLSFCLDDGKELLFGPSTIDEPATAMLSSPDLIEAGTRRFTSDDLTPTAAVINKPSNSNSLIAAALGFVLISALALAGYMYYGRAASKQIESIAVMPFVNESGNADIEYLSDGMTETLIGSLTNVPNLNVKARSSVFRYKGKETDAKTIGKELNVQAILNGRIAQRGDELTLSLELMDVATENAIWSQQYTRKQSEIVSLQSQIAKDVSTRLKAKLSGAEETKVTRSATTDPEAYQAYLKGRFYWNQRGQGSDRMAAAIEQFKVATTKDPNYALAYAGLADCYVLLPQETGAPPSEVLPQAKAFANRALEIDDSMAEAHATLGLIDLYLWQWSESKNEYERAIQLNPSYPTGHQWYAGLLGALGRSNEQFAEVKKAYELDPLSPVISANLGLAYLERNELSSATEQFNKTLEVSPNYFVVHSALAIVYLKLGKANEALLEAQRSVELSKRHPYALSVFGQINAALGNRNPALAIIEELEHKPFKGDSDKYFISCIYAGLGDKDQAFAWLDKGVQEHGAFISNLRIDPLTEAFRNDPRFKDILRRMGLPE